MRRTHTLVLILFVMGLFVWKTDAQAAPCLNPLDLGEQALPGDVAASLDLPALRDFYSDIPGSCVWSNKSETELIAALSDAERQGLSPQIFHAAALMGTRKTRERGLRDLLLTDAAIRYAHIMRNGQVRLESVESDVDFPRPDVQPQAGLRMALATNDVAGWLRAQTPQQAQYAKLVEAFAQYREIAARGGWPRLEAPEKSLKPGETSALVPQLRERLRVEGDLDTRQTPADPQLYDAVLVEALKHFQVRNGLKVDGVLGPNTLAHINISAAERVNQIMLNLERWRMLSDGLEPTRIEVNVAAADATLYVEGRPAMRMRTIVGAKKTPTPIMRSGINMVVVNPSWTVPRSITANEILPRLQREPDYMEKNNMSWQDNYIVQAPGAGNALGRIKFEMPSSFGVYLHDTPARSLFASEKRARSHGCVRLEKPLEFAAYLLRNDVSWSRQRIEEAIAQGGTLNIPLQKHIQAAIVYWTSFVNADGVVEFREDIYGRDERLLAALMQRPSYSAGAQARAPVRSCTA